MSYFVGALPHLPIQTNGGCLSLYPRRTLCMPLAANNESYGNADNTIPWLRKPHWLRRWGGAESSTE